MKTEEITYFSKKAERLEEVYLRRHTFAKVGSNPYEVPVHPTLSASIARIMSSKPTDGRHPPPKKSAKLQVMRYTTGLRIPQSGIYKVIHSQHRLPHDVTLLAGQYFPRCASCGTAVQFELVRAAQGIDESRFHVVIYELPDAEAAG